MNDAVLIWKINTHFFYCCSEQFWLSKQNWQHVIKSCFHFCQCQHCQHWIDAIFEINYKVADLKKMFAYLVCTTLVILILMVSLNPKVNQILQRLGREQCEYYGTVHFWRSNTSRLCHKKGQLYRKVRYIATVELQWLDHLWNHEKVLETGRVRANRC